MSIDLHRMANLEKYIEREIKTYKLLLIKDKDRSWLCDKKIDLEVLKVLNNVKTILEGGEINV